MKPVSSDARRLIDSLGRFPRTVVAFSGGVDSSVVAAAAHRANGTSAVAVTAHSPSVPQWQLDVASRVAHEIGIEHRVVQTKGIETIIAATTGSDVFIAKKPCTRR
jgi:uncharacterized protein